MKNFIRAEWPITLVYFAIGVSLALTVWVDFRSGAIGIALSVLLSLVLRYFLTDDQAGMLRVRRRRIDLTVLATLGIALLILAIVVPGPHT